ncbi:MAG: aminotransferase class I/II-fold pyridoxal phosphate-dependent enzyme [Bacteroidetes bacterium]|nr:aminotransferase class I/II-fold pyridoxal phosphate-dependent enzyme [Bacteroidota bacterium]MBS1981003.1 aminotransferase class I/II-fold pyridoxal phosphate-dependent enzyme [Bacteroidota bacterium]
METKFSRRDWFKSTAALSAGMIASASLFDQLIAAPMSRAEFNFLSSANGAKIRLGSNENPYGPSAKAREAVVQILSEGNRYPFEAIKELKLVLAAKEGVTPDHIHVGAGSGDLLCQAATAFGIEGGRIASGFPTFPLMMEYARVFNATWDKVDMNEKLEYNYDELASALKNDTKLVFICNPNNPTGTLVDWNKVKSFCEEVSKKVPVYSDEAYLEFLEPSQQISMVELVKKDRNVIVSRTFSKIYGLAGLRIGYLVAKPELINKVAKYGGDFPYSQTAIAAAKASLGDESFMSMVRTKNAAARKVLTDYLDQHKIVYGKSLTNFVFFPAHKDGKTILSKMSERGYIMRIWDYQNKEWCRVSIGTEDEMKGFVKTFAEVIS